MCWCFLIFIITKAHMSKRSNWSFINQKIQIRIKHNFRFFWCRINSSKHSHQNSWIFNFYWFSCIIIVFLENNKNFKIIFTILQKQQEFLEKSLNLCSKKFNFTTDFKASFFVRNWVLINHIVLIMTGKWQFRVNNQFICGITDLNL